MELSTAIEIGSETSSNMITEEKHTLNNCVINDPYPSAIPLYQGTGWTTYRLSEGPFLNTGKVDLPKKVQGVQTETIREWFKGEVLEVHNEEKYFVARLRDLTGPRVDSIAEFDIDLTFEDSSDIEQFLFPGAEFAFFVVTKHSLGNPVTQSSIEFTTPHIWRVEDEQKAKELFQELFPDEPPLE